MALAGFAYSCMVVSSFSRAQRRVLDMGFADDINTYVMISGKLLNNHKQTISVFSNFKYLFSFKGIWLSAFSLGNFVGPTIAGILVQTQNFQTTTLIFFSLYVVMVIIDSVEALLKCRRSNMYDRRIQYESIN